MYHKYRFLYTFIGMVLTLALLVAALASCDDGGDKTTSSTVATTAAAEITSIPSGTPTVVTTNTEPSYSDEPVKIGIIAAWSGSGGMVGWLSDATADLMEWYVDKQGGILVGGVRRPVEFIKCDMKSIVSQAAACAVKLIDDDHVSVITQGGTTTADMFAIANVTDPKKMPYVHFGTNVELGTDYNWTATTISTGKERAELFNDFIVNTLKANSVSLLAEEMADGRAVWSRLKPMLEEAGVEILSESWVIPGTSDLSPNLTAIKYEAPDVLFSYLNSGTYAAMYKQIDELGGWDDIRNFAGNEHSNTQSIAAIPGANGSYTLASYMPGSDDPGVVAFEEAWAQKAKEDTAFAKKYRAAPMSTHPYSWNCLLVAIKAVELAGSDEPADIAKALRSGELEVDTAFGHMRIQPDGSAGVKDSIVQIQNGDLILLN